MHISIKILDQILFEGFSTTAGEITDTHGDVTMKFQKVRALHPAGVGQLVIKLHRDEFIQVGLMHHASVEESLGEIAELISSGASIRRIRQRIDHWQRYWDLSDKEILDFLQRVESPLETLKRELTATATPSLTPVFGLKERVIH